MKRMETVWSAYIFQLFGVFVCVCAVSVCRSLKVRERQTRLTEHLKGMYKEVVSFLPQLCANIPLDMNYVIS